MIVNNNESRDLEVTLLLIIVASTLTIIRGLRASDICAYPPLVPAVYK